MAFVSTRDSTKKVSFKDAILNSIPQDGGLYVPESSMDLRKWILYADEKTSFASLAGSLTQALINEEFSPIICETIATRAFPQDPILKKLDDSHYLLGLYNGATGTSKDYGVAYLAAALETILCYNDDRAILLDATSGELGSCIAHSLRDKKLLKSVLIYPKGKVRGLDPKDFVWNGGNVFPVEVEGTVQDCQNLVRRIFENKELVAKYHLTGARTSNIGRLLPQSFFYMYAFAQLKKNVSEDIYYALDAGNYGNIVSGLYGWMFSLPLTGFIVPSTPNLCLDAAGNPVVLDSMVSPELRGPVDMADPSNIERLEHVFRANPLLLRSFVYPAQVSQEQREQACKELYKKFGIYADSELCGAYVASKLRDDVVDVGEGDAVVMIQRTDSYFDRDFISRNIGEEPDLCDNVREALKTVEIGRPAIGKDDQESLVSILNSVNLRRIFG